MHAVLARALLCAAAALTAGCGAPPANPEPAAPAAGGSHTVDMHAIFPAGEGRDIVLNNCQNCHTFVPIVVLQMDRDAWQRNSLDHRERLPGLPDEDFGKAYAYLAEHFHPGRPVPELPAALLETWTSY